MILLTLISSLWLGVRITITGAIIPSLVVTVDHTEHISTSVSVGGFPISHGFFLRSEVDIRYTAVAEALTPLLAAGFGVMSTLGSRDSKTIIDIHPRLGLLYRGLSGRLLSLDCELLWFPLSLNRTKLNRSFAPAINTEFLYKLR